MKKKKIINEFPYSNTNKRYHTLDYHFKKKYNQKVGRVSIDGGFSCPNIDGTKARGGCTYCSVRGSGDFIIKHKSELLEQWEVGKEKLHQKWPSALFIAYFQAYSNTYGSVETLKSKFEVFRAQEDCLAIYIGTRSDCIDREKVEYLAEINKEKKVVIELGLQTIKQSTLKSINQQETIEDFEKAYEMLRENEIEIIVHVINGLPGETREDMLATVKYLAQLDIQGIKIHMLHLLEQTKMGIDYKKEPFPLLSREEYVALVAEQIRMLPPEMVVHRVTGDAPGHLLIAPEWIVDKTVVLNEIDKLMARNLYYQGDLYENK